ncbi:MAG: fused DSP-PTPase phosphatase/NAD kinase-like protein [Planctomycetota bacterium]|jgi:protein tyrosine/serine phosphatase
MQKKPPVKLFITIVLAAIAVVSLVRHFHIKNFHVVVPGVLYTSGQPKGMDYTRLLYKYHIATFINVRVASEHREQNWYNEEMTWMRENGVNYIEMPIERKDRNRQFPDEQTQKQFLDIMADPANLPVLIHGSSGRKRESILSAVWLIKAKGYTAAQAVGVVEKIKEKPTTKYEKEFIKSIAE